MKPFYITVLFTFISLQAYSQPDFAFIQNDWISSVNKGESFQQLLFPKGYLLYFNGNPTFSSQENPVDDFGIDGELADYQQIKQFEHDQFRFLTLADVSLDQKVCSLLTGWRKTETKWSKEIDILLAQTSDSNVSDSAKQQLNNERKEWIEFANRHDPAEHIRTSYTKDAVYFSNGMRSDGHSGITERYAYMKNPNYQVDLEVAYLRQTSDTQIIEVGRYFTGKVHRGSGGIYVILWQKQAEDWQIGMDFNF
ncbi:hypothetical protein LQ318_13480 [Aliifodinibius salicampi]|uniref:DUF4440 domain-containing protein n=1 Tax=Fodinibius salicampi TaxID=1920655 RepID=A0ABT3Q1E0_9BACT|nr:hypothetical protein [Fodinibius salicampi]MCW9713917.1 hypothetical protein [Fodinibius salicampi]